jgi:hypothetical protein
MPWSDAPEFGQTSSYFALRNDHWILVGLKTSYDDHDLHGTARTATCLKSSWTTSCSRSSTTRRGERLWAQPIEKDVL